LQFPRASKHEKAASDGGFFHCREIAADGLVLSVANRYERVGRILLADCCGASARVDLHHHDDQEADE
jgi:hypothetical protein